MYCRGIARTVLFLAILTLLLFIANRQFGRNNQSRFYGYKYGELFKGNRGINAVIIGSSHAVHGINPGCLDGAGYDFYNYAYEGASPLFVRDWYQQGFRRAHVVQPKLVIYSVDWFMFDETWLWRDFLHDSEYFPAGMLFSQLAANPGKLDDILFNRFPLLKYRDELRLLLRAKKHSPYRVDSYCKGFVPWENVAVKFAAKPVKSTTEPDKVGAFRALLRELVRDGSRVVLVEPPEYLAGRTADGFERNNRLLGQIAAEFGMPFLNYNEEYVSALNGDQQCFSDWGHLNGQGSTRFSRMLKRDLAAVLK